MKQEAGESLVLIRSERSVRLCELNYPVNHCELAARAQCVSYCARERKPYFRAEFQMRRNSIIVARARYDFDCRRPIVELSGNQSRARAINGRRPEFSGPEKAERRAVLAKSIT